MATVALAAGSEFPVIRSAYEHYRIGNAEYALVGWEQEIGPAARLLASRLAAEGFRLGVLTLRRYDRETTEACRLLLSPLSRVMVIGESLFRELIDVLAEPCGPH